MLRCLFCVVILMSGLVSASAESPQTGIPTYAEAHLLFEKHWKEHFPVMYSGLHDVDPGHRMLVAEIQGVSVYYYRFQVDLPRLFRSDSGRVESESEPARRVEVWFRYQPQMKHVDFAFAREDLLPGTNRRWIE